MVDLFTPAVTVEIGFDSGGSRQSVGTVYGSLVWTDVTAYVLASQGVTFSRGRAEAGQSAAAGQLTVTFDNTDGRFTPGTTGGPYGRVRTRMPVRVRGYLTYGATESGPFGDEYGTDEYATGTPATLWVGFITDVDWQMDAGQAIVSMSASDIIATAARTKMGPWHTKRTQALATGLINYWPLTDTAPNALSNLTSNAVPAVIGEAARATVGPTPAIVGGNSAADLSFNVTSDLSPDATAEPVFSLTPVSGSGKYLAATTTLASTGDLAVSMWARPTTTTSVCLLACSYTGTGVNTFALFTQSDGTPTIAAAYSGGAYVTFAGSLPVDEWSHVYIERDNSVTTPAPRFRMWVDAVELAGFSSGSMTSDANTAIQLNIGGDSVTGINDFSGQLGHVAVWDTLDDTRAAFLASQGWGATCAVRFAELHYQTPNPTGLSSWMDADSEAENLVSPQAANGKSLLQVAEEVADAERGSIIATRDGKLRLLAQRYAIAPAAVSVSLSADTDILSLDNTFGVDDSDNLNECAVTLQPSGWRYTAARVDDPGVESTLIDIWSPDTFFAVALAGQIANADTERPRAPSLSLSMEWLAHAGLADPILGLELGDTIEVTDLPTQAPATDLTLQVRTIEHDISSAGWTVTIDTDPPTLGAVLDDTDRGLVGSTTVLGV